MTRGSEETEWTWGGSVAAPHWWDRRSGTPTVPGVPALRLHVFCQSLIYLDTAVFGISDFSKSAGVPSSVDQNYQPVYDNQILGVARLVTNLVPCADAHSPTHRRLDGPRPAPMRTCRLPATRDARTPCQRALSVQPTLTTSSPCAKARS